MESIIVAIRSDVWPNNFVDKRKSVYPTGPSIKMVLLISKSNHQTIPACEKKDRLLIYNLILPWPLGDFSEGWE